MKQQTTNATDADISEERQRELKQSAQRELAAGVLKHAARDLRYFCGGTSKGDSELYRDACPPVPHNAWDFSTWFVLVSPLIGVVVGFLSLLVLAR